MSLRALARVNLAAIERNVARLRRELGPGQGLCAVVKADGYGHGAAPAARAALDGGASWLAVATAGESLELRRAGIRERILVMGAIGDDELPLALEADADMVAWDPRFVESVLKTAPERAVRLHVKLDTGMGRLGTREPRDALAVAELIVKSQPALELAGAMTHFATADERSRVPRPPAHAVRSLREADAPGRARDNGPRRQQRGDPDRSREPLRPGALRDRDLRL